MGALLLLTLSIPSIVPQIGDDSQIPRFRFDESSSIGELLQGTSTTNRYIGCFSRDYRCDCRIPKKGVRGGLACEDQNKVLTSAVSVSKFNSKFKHQQSCMIL